MLQKWSQDQPFCFWNSVTQSKQWPNLCCLPVILREGDPPHTTIETTAAPISLRSRRVPNLQPPGTTFWLEWHWGALQSSSKWLNFKPTFVTACVLWWCIHIRCCLHWVYTVELDGISKLAEPADQPSSCICWVTPLLGFQFWLRGGQGAMRLEIWVVIWCLSASWQLVPRFILSTRANIQIPCISGTSGRSKPDFELQTQVCLALFAAQILSIGHPRYSPGEAFKARRIAHRPRQRHLEIPQNGYLNAYLSYFDANLKPW